MKPQLMNLHLLVFLPLLLPVQVSGTSCAVSHLKSLQEFHAADGIMFSTPEQGARSWKWSVKAHSGPKYPVTASWIGQTQLVQLFSPQFKAGRKLSLLIDGKNACVFFCGEEEKQNPFILRIKNSPSATRYKGIAERWNLTSVQIDNEGSTLQVDGKSYDGPDSEHFVARLEEIDTEGSHKKQYQSIYPTRTAAGDSTMHLSKDICTSDGILVKHGHSYTIALFRPVKGHFVKSGGWRITVPEREGFNESELLKLKEFEKLYEDYMQDVKDKSKSDSLMNWVKSNKELNDRYVASKQKTSLFQGKDLQASILHTDQISDLEITH